MLNCLNLIFEHYLMNTELCIYLFQQYNEHFDQYPYMIHTDSILDANLRHNCLYVYGYLFAQDMIDEYVFETTFGQFIDQCIEYHKQVTKYFRQYTCLQEDIIEYILLKYV